MPQIDEKKLAEIKAKMQAAGISEDKLASMKKLSGKQKAAFFMSSFLELIRYMSKYRMVILLAIVLSVVI